MQRIHLGLDGQPVVQGGDDGDVVDDDGDGDDDGDNNGRAQPQPRVFLHRMGGGGGGNCDGDGDGDGGMGGMTPGLQNIFAAAAAAGDAVYNFKII